VYCIFIGVLYLNIYVDLDVDDRYYNKRQDELHAARVHCKPEVKI
jgi:hypothetical protein